MPRMTGGQALVKALYQEGVRVIFGLPGVQLYHALDPLYDEPRIRFITTRHEQATTYMADGFSRAGGGIGTALVVPGPGLLNATAGIGTAYAASSPILVLSGQVQRELIGVNRGVLHEIHDQLDAVRPITKWAHRVVDPTLIPDAVHEAFYHLRTGRPRPVELEIPPETLEEVADIDFPKPGNYQRQVASEESLLEAIRVLGNSKRPLIWAGGGVNSSGASDALMSIADYLQAPVITTGEGKGSISDKHYLSFGVPRNTSEPIGKEIANYDLVIAVGTRLATPHLLNGQQVLQIDVDSDEIGRNYDKTVGLVGDAKLTLEALYRIMQNNIPKADSREGELAAIKSKILEESRRLEPQDSFNAAIRSAIPDDGILVAGMTQLGYYSRAYYPVYWPGTYLNSSYFGNLGFAFPVALGAKVAQPERSVVAISGDGGFLYNSQELATAVKYGINVVTVVFNDNAYGNVLRDQQTRFEGRTLGADLHNPDFVKLAEAYGARGVRVEGPEKLEAELKYSLGFQGPTLIEVPVGMMPNPFS